MRNESDVQELVSDTFLRMHRAIGRFRGDSSLRTWANRIAVNLARNRYWYWKRRGRGKELSLDHPMGEDDSGTFADIIPDDLVDVRSALETQELEDRIRQAMRQLSPAAREILLLRIDEHLDYEQIAARLGLNIGTVKSKIARAREHLRAALEGLNAMPVKEAGVTPAHPAPRPRGRPRKNPAAPYRSPFWPERKTSKAHKPTDTFCVCGRPSPHKGVVCMPIRKSTADTAPDIPKPSSLGEICVVAPQLCPETIARRAYHRDYYLRNKDRLATAKKTTGPSVREQLADRIYDGIEAGLTNRAIMRSTGAHTVTVSKYRALHEQTFAPVRCACGMPATHRGWCRVRLSANPARQDVLVKLHLTQKIQTVLNQLVAEGKVKIVGEQGRRDALLCRPPYRGRPDDCQSGMMTRAILQLEPQGSSSAGATA